MRIYWNDITFVMVSILSNLGEQDVLYVLCGKLGLTASFFFSDDYLFDLIQETKLFVVDKKNKV